MTLLTLLLPAIPPHRLHKTIHAFLAPLIPNPSWTCPVQFPVSCPSPPNLPIPSIPLHAACEGPGASLPVCAIRQLLCNIHAGVAGIVRLHARVTG